MTDSVKKKRCEMKKVDLIWVVAFFLFILSAPTATLAVTIYTNDFFNDINITYTSGLGSNSPGVYYWGLSDGAPVTNNPAGNPSYFQNAAGTFWFGRMLYGAYYKGFGDTLPNAAISTFKISGIDVSGYTNIKLTMAFAAAEGIFEDSYWQKPPDKLVLKINEQPLDTFKYYSLGQEHQFSFQSSKDPSVILGRTFKDITYSLPNGLTSLTIDAFNTENIEIFGFDSVRITGDPVNPVPTPEPSTIILLGSGLMGLGLWGRRKFKART